MKTSPSHRWLPDAVLRQSQAFLTATTGNRRITHCYCGAIAAGMTLLCWSSAFSETLSVGSDPDLFDFTSIQAAVDAASDGDEVVVSPGTYTSSQPGHVVDMKGKAITLLSLIHI